VPLTTVTVAGLLVPPEPVQVIEYVVVVDSAPVLCVPLGGLAPLHPPLAVQLAALDELHDKTAAPPAVTALELAVNTTLGAAGGTTSTVILAGSPVPPGPVQVRVYVVLWVN
jgi:hypothetical protein